MKTLEKAVRPATEDDLEAINDIYNHYVRTSHATFDIHEKTKEWRRVWFEDRQSDPHRVFVAQRDGHLLGFASSGAHRSKPAYRTSVETSVYVAPDSVGRGIGKALYGALFTAFRGQDVHRAVAGIALPTTRRWRFIPALGFGWSAGSPNRAASSVGIGTSPGTNARSANVGSSPRTIGPPGVRQRPSTSPAMDQLRRKQVA